MISRATGALPPSGFPALPWLTWGGWDTPFLFFTGKGGVGKSTVASTVAVRLADAGRTVLLVSTDPASNLGDIFQMPAATTPTPVPNLPNLFLLNIDPDAAAAAYRERIVGPYRGVLPDAAVQGIEEQLSGACTVEIATFNEFTELLAPRSTRERFDHIVFDTAPTGHTLRLLTLASAWTGFLDANIGGASCLGPVATLDAQREQYEATIKALADDQQTTLVLVSRPETSALEEAVRASRELASLDMRNQRLIVNGLFPEAAPPDGVAAALRERQRESLQSMPRTLQEMPASAIPLVPSQLTGLDALRALASAGAGGVSGEAVTEGAGDHQVSLVNEDIEGLDALLDQLESDGPGVIMTMGKGGVGKTTMAAAIAITLAKRGHIVHLSTTDPAAHLQHVLGGDRVEGLSVSRIDPHAETERYTREVVESASYLDDEGRALLEEDLRSPCTEEIAVFRAFARIVGEAGDGYVVLDTAPTGHTILLLDAAQSYHRDVARSTGEVPDEVRSLLPRLRDSAWTRVLLVTLAETTPVAEAERLQVDLLRAGIVPYGWVINATMIGSGTRDPLLRRRAELERLQVHRVRQDLAAHVWLVPWQATVPQGTRALQELAS
jgi:arsenite/tail-anchored protein-transporting ATPase